MDIRFLSFVEYLQTTKYFENSSILQEEQAVQISISLKSDVNKMIVYDIAFQEDCIDSIQIIGFYAHVPVISKKLLLALNECNTKYLNSLYVIHRGKDNNYLRIVRQVPAFFSNEERNEKIFVELENLHREIDSNFILLASLWM